MPFGEEVVEGCFEIPSCRFEALVARAERLQLGVGLVAEENAL